MTASASPEPANRLEHFPVSFFSMVMGLAGLSIALQKAGQLVLWLHPVGVAVLLLAGALFIVLAAIYAAKAVLHPDAIRGEIRHPVRLHFVPTISIGLILLSIGTLELDRGVAQALLLVGAPLQLVFTLMVLDHWLNREHFQTPHLNPAWFIPIVGNILVPIAGVSLGYTELSWLFFSIGIAFWLPLLAIILNRIVFHPTMPERLRPTLFILIAPPAVGFLSYLKLAGGLDAFARVLFFFGAFLTLLLLTQVPRLRRLPFFLSWWAYSFPLAAITVASFAMAEKTQIVGYLWLAFVLLAVATALISVLLVRTAVAAYRHEICQPE